MRPVFLTSSAEVGEMLPDKQAPDLPTGFRTLVCTKASRHCNASIVIRQADRRWCLGSGLLSSFLMGQQSSCCEKEEEAVPKEVVLHRHDVDYDNVKTCLPDDEKEEVVVAASRMSLAQCRLQKMEHLAVDQEILRGISLREC